MQSDNSEFVNRVSHYQNTPRCRAVAAVTHTDERVSHLLYKSEALVSRSKKLHRESQVLSKQLQALYADSDEVISHIGNASEVSPLVSTSPTGQRKSDHE